jgi:hypothetical protein
MLCPFLAATLARAIIPPGQADCPYHALDEAEDGRILKLRLGGSNVRLHGSERQVQRFVLV